MSRYGYGYDAIHKRLRKERGPARNFECVECGNQANHWAYQHTAGDNEQRTHGLPFSSNVEDYAAMCAKCHRKLDLAKDPNSRERLVNSGLRLAATAKRPQKKPSRKGTWVCMGCGYFASFWGVQSHQKNTGHVGKAPLARQFTNT